MDIIGNTALLIASYSNSDSVEEILDYAIESNQKIDLNDIGNGGSTALISAAEFDTHAVQAILNYSIKNWNSY